MRKHGLFGVVIATLLGTVGLLQLASGTPHATSSHATTGTQLTAEEISADRSQSGVSALLPNGYLRVIATPAWLHVNLSALNAMARNEAAQAAAAKAEAIEAARIAAAQAAAARAAAAKAAAQAAAQAAQARAEAAAAARRAAAEAAARQKAAAAAAAARARPSPPPSTGSGYVPLGGAWAELRDCESGGNYATDTGNGYYGAYQFSLATWEGLGFSGLPSDASPAVQDRAAQELQARSGWGQWPACSAELGLT